MFFYFLFNDFYQKSYKKKQAAAKAKADKESITNNNNDSCAKNLNAAIATNTAQQKKVL